MTKKAKGSEEKDLEKKPNALVRTWRRFSNWCHEMKVELKKVVWPKRKELVRACLVVAAVHPGHRRLYLGRGRRCRSRDPGADQSVQGLR